MNTGAHVESIDAVREFLAALHTFAHDVRDAIGSFDLEVQTSMDELLQSEPSFLQHELRKADEAVSRAKIELERCRVSKLPGGEPRSCIDERKQFERARLKRQYIEEKLDTVRRWAHQVRPQVDEYTARATQLTTVMDSEFPKAVLMLNRVLDALETYTSAEPQASRGARFTTDAAKSAESAVSEQDGGPDGLNEHKSDAARFGEPETNVADDGESP